MKLGADYRRASNVSQARRPQAHCGIVRIRRTLKEVPPFFVLKFALRIRIRTRWTRVES
jgi:hypothetical protein